MRSVKMRNNSQTKKNIYLVDLVLQRFQCDWGKKGIRDARLRTTRVFRKTDDNTTRRYVSF